MIQGASLALFALAALTACDGGPSGAERSSALGALVAPHAERLTRFDRWAHRVASAGGAWRSRSALEETVFSQVRGDASVVGAWVEREGEPALALPAERAMPEAEMRAIRLPTLGPCEAGTARLVRGRGPEEVDVVLVTLDHDDLRTTLALAIDPQP